MDCIRNIRKRKKILKNIEEEVSFIQVSNLYFLPAKKIHYFSGTTADQTKFFNQVENVPELEEGLKLIPQESEK